MPIPKPKSGESEKEFISRCMANPNMQEYSDKQRAAICYNTFRETKKIDLIANIKKANKLIFRKKNADNEI